MEGCFISDLIPREEMKKALQDLDMGIETLRFGIGMNLDDLDYQLEEAKEELAWYGNPPLSIHGPFLDLNPMSFDSRIRQATIDRFQQAYEAAQRLGAEKIVYHTCRVPATIFLQGWGARMVDFWNEFLEDKSGIAICMENVFDPEYTGILEVAEGVSHPDFGLCLDIGHAHCFSQASVMEWVEALAGHIRHVHIHDNDGSRDAHWGLGRGNIPLDQVLPALHQANPEMTWTIECNSLEDICRSGAYLSNILRQAK